MKNSRTSEGTTGTLKSLRRIVAVLDCFSRYERSLSLAEIASKTGLPKSTAHRMLASMREVGFIEFTQDRNRYRLGLRLLGLGSIVLANMDLYTEAYPFVERLMQVSGEGVHLCVFDGRNIIMVDHREPDGRMANWVTTISGAPAYCTGVGKAALAFQPFDAVEAVIEAGLRRFTRNTIVDRGKFLQELELTRARGYAVDNGEHQPGVRCVAAPIRDATDVVFAAISVSGSAMRVTEDQIETLAELVMDVADQISRRLGYCGPGPDIGLAIDISNHET
jgi:DNA-binding IclR family transcriptional regulator